MIQPSGIPIDEFIKTYGSMKGRGEKRVDFPIIGSLLSVVGGATKANFVIYQSEAKEIEDCGRIPNEDGIYGWILEDMDQAFWIDFSPNIMPTKVELLLGGNVLNPSNTSFIPSVEKVKMDPVWQQQDPEKWELAQKLSRKIREVEDLLNQVSGLEAELKTVKSRANIVQKSANIKGGWLAQDMEEFRISEKIKRQTTRSAERPKEEETTLEF